MLANQFFMARKYKEALPLLVDSLKKFPDDKGIKRKLIICYNQTGDLHNSLQLFHSLILTDIEFIINAHPIYDDCPCSEIIKKYNNKNELTIEGLDSTLHFAILMLFCDTKQALNLFKKAVMLSPEDKQIREITSKIEEYVSLH